MRAGEGVQAFGPENRERISESNVQPWKVLECGLLEKRET